LLGNVSCLFRERNETRNHCERQAHKSRQCVKEGSDLTTGQVVGTRDYFF